MSKLTKYIDEKIDMLEKEFCMKLTARDKRHFYNLKSEYEVDQFAHTLFLKEDWEGKEFTDGY